MATLKQRIAALEERTGTDFDLSALTHEERGLWAVLMKKAEGLTPAGMRLLDTGEADTLCDMMEKIDASAGGHHPRSPENPSLRLHRAKTA